MMKDRRVPVGSKILAIAIGFGVTSILVAVEFPLEAVVAVILPFIGAAADVIVDGFELLVFPLLISLCLLPRIAKAR